MSDETIKEPQYTERPFVTVEKIDMKIYGADKADALWYKNWCDKQGIPFSIGIKLMRLAVEKDTMYVMLMKTLNDQIARMDNLEQGLDKLDSKVEELKSKPEAPKNRRFGVKV